MLTKTWREHISHKAILVALDKHGALTLDELVLITGYNRNGIRGRLSELDKHLGYSIKKEQRQVTTTKYSLGVPSDPIDLFFERTGLDWGFEDENFMRENFSTMSIEELAKKFGRTVDEVHKKAVFMGMMANHAKNKI